MKSHLKSVLSAVLGLCFALLVLCPLAVYAVPSSNQDSEMVGGISDVSTALTAYVNNVVGANGNDKHNDQKVENPGNVGNAGAYVGYGDKTIGSQFITSNMTSGSSSSTYDAWLGILDGSDSNAVYSYVRFGKTLADAGLDETMSADTTKDIGRLVTGGLSLLVFAASELVPTVFTYALGFLKVFNIFGLFDYVHVINWASAFPSLDAALQPLVRFFSNMYTTIFNEISMLAVIPLLICGMIVSILLLRRPAGTQFMNTMKKIVFILVGVPLLASLYTASLNSLSNVTQEGSATARLAASSFVDFESWAENRLQIPGNVLIESSPKGTDGAVNAGGIASQNMLLKLRNSALALNKANNDVFRDTHWTMPGATSTGHDDAWAVGGMWNNDRANGSWDSTLVNEDVRAELFGLLTRYMMSEQYTPAAWATKVSKDWRDTGSMGSSQDEGSVSNTVRAMLNSTDSVDDWMNRVKSDNAAIWSKRGNTELAWANQGFNMFADGDLRTSSPASETSTVRYDSGKLSTLSMYNYLSTSFQDSSIVTYSNSNSVSEHVKQAHMSVTAVGNGVLGFLFMLNFWVCSGVVALIGVYFAFSMTLKNLKTSFQLLMSIPISLLGLSKSIAQVIMYTLMMIAQIVVGAFMYSFMSDILVVLSTVVEGLAKGSIAISQSTPPIEPASVILASLGITSSSVLLGMVILCEIGFVLVAGSAVWKYRRAFVYGYDCGLTWMMRNVTLPEFVEVFDAVWVRHEQSAYGYQVGVPFTEVLMYLREDTSLIKKGGIVV